MLLSHKNSTHSDFKVDFCIVLFGQGGLSAAPARAVSAVKNMNLPEIPRNINIGDINIKVPSLSPFWAASQLSSAGPMYYWCLHFPAVPLHPALWLRQNCFYICTTEPQQLTLPFIPIFSHAWEISCGLFLSSTVYNLQITLAEGFAQ